MNLSIDQRYNTYSLSIVLHLIHTNSEYNKIWCDKFPDTVSQASNYAKNTDCGCRPVLVKKYRQFRFEADIMTVGFINDNPSCINFDKFCEEVGGQDLHGTVFSVNNTESDFKDFLAILQQKKASFQYFNALPMGEKILVSFF